MKRNFCLLIILCVILLSACTDCTECDAFYVPASGDTVFTADSYCGKIGTVKDFEGFFTEDAKSKAYLAGSTATVNCVRIKAD